MATGGNTLEEREAYIERLLAHERAAINAAKEKLHELKEIENNYLQLKERLVALPTRLCHSVTVPLNSVGFFQGQLIHTNEITVLLSSEILVQVTASTALEILNRRVDECRSRQDKAEQEISHFTHWQEYTVKSTGGRTGLPDDGVDITEEFDEQREAEWRKQHSERVRKHCQRERTELKKASDDADESALWQRLEELEMEEEMEKYEEMTKERGSQPGGDRDRSETQVPLRLSQDAALKDTVINIPSSNVVTAEPTSSAPSCDPKSILKRRPSGSLKSVHFEGASEARKVSDQTSAIDSDDDEVPEEEEDDRHESAFTGFIVERSCGGGASVDEQDLPREKKVSRFKASRM